MKNKSKKNIIIGLTCLFLAIILLLGLTYAYYRTKVIGNNLTNPSVSGISKLAEITYQDGSSEMNMEGFIEPGFEASKTFYVENTGNQIVKYSIMIEDMNNTFVRTEDWTWTLTENETKIEEGTLSSETNQILSGSRTIAETKGTVNTYVFTLKYENSKEDQTIDMGATLSFKINIADEQNGLWDAVDGTLLYALSVNQPQGTEETTPGQEQPTSNEARIVTTKDNTGTSYVYRGNVTNNFVNYSGMCWRVVRVQGDNNIKLVLADENNECDSESYSPDNTTSAFITYKEEIGMPYYVDIIEVWSKDLDTSKIVDGYFQEIKNVYKTEQVCLNSNGIKPENQPECSESVYSYCSYCGNSAGCGESCSNYYNNMCSSCSRYEEDIYYDAYRRYTTKSPSLEGEYTTKNIGFLNIDEVMFAGTKGYLLTNASGKEYFLSSTTSKQYSDGLSSYFEYVYTIKNSSVYSSNSYDDYAIRPSIVLSKDVTIETGGIGTQEKPYVIN